MDNVSCFIRKCTLNLTSVVEIIESATSITRCHHNDVHVLSILLLSYNHSIDISDIFPYIRTAVQYIGRPFDLGIRIGPTAPSLWPPSLHIRMNLLESILLGRHQERLLHNRYSSSKSLLVGMQDQSLGSSSLKLNCTMVLQNTNSTSSYAQGGNSAPYLVPLRYRHHYSPQPRR